MVPQIISDVVNACDDQLALDVAFMRHRIRFADCLEAIDGYGRWLLAMIDAERAIVSAYRQEHS